MSLPPIYSPKQQHENKVIASHNFGDIKRGSRNREGKDTEEHKTNMHNVMLKLDELEERDSMQESNREMIENNYEEESDEDDKIEENAESKITKLDALRLPRISAHYSTSPTQNVKKDFVTPPHINTNNNPYISSQESNPRGSNINDQEQCSKLWSNGYGIKYLEAILKDKCFDKEIQINSTKIPTEINLMRASIKVNECDLKNNILKLILNDKEDDLFLELEKIKLLKGMTHRYDSNTNLNKDSVINTSINVPTLHDVERECK